MKRQSRMLSCLLVACLVAISGCDGPGAEEADSSVDPECGNPTPGNPLLGCPGLGECIPTACDSGGATWEEIHKELKTFWQTQPTCTELPAELLCRNKSVESGDDWPEQLEADIQSAAEMSGGFLDEQIQALRCLGAMEPSDALSVVPGDPDSRLPSKLLVGLEMPGPAAGVSLHDEFLDRFGAQVGTILHVTDDYEFEQERKAPSDYDELRLSAVSYKGIAVDPDEKLRIDVNLGHVYWPEGPDNSEPCPDRWVFVDLTTTLSRHIETLETDPGHLLSGEDAVNAVLAECGEECSHPVTVWDDVESGPDLFISTEHVVWRVMVDCPVDQWEDELWMCTYRVDAETGDVLSGGQECCID